jgi:hypothetical protein
VKKFNITVPRNAELPVFTGSLAGDQTAVKAGDEFSVMIYLKADRAESFNAYRFTMSFSTSSVEYVGISDSTATVELNGGSLVISGIGTERTITDTITVTFRAKKGGVTDVKLVKVEMDSAPDATLETLPVMNVENGVVTIEVEKVTAPEAPVETKDESSAIWIVIAIAVAVLIAAGVVVLILIKKKKQVPTAEA